MIPGTDPVAGAPERIGEHARAQLRRAVPPMPPTGLLPLLLQRLAQRLAVLPQTIVTHAASVAPTAVNLKTGSGEVLRFVDRQDLLHRHFRNAVKAAGLPVTLRLDDLRHTAATLLLAAGVHPKVASERLGHARTTMTLDTYSHVMPDMQREASDKMEEPLGNH